MNRKLIGSIRQNAAVNPCSLNSELHRRVHTSGQEKIQKIRAAIYARYWSENQSDRSIEDQIRVCREYAESRGWEVSFVYSDSAMSGTVLARPELDLLLAKVRDGKVDVVLCHTLDRLSRDQEHLPGIYKIMAFADVPIVTVSEGVITPLHVGLMGVVSASFLKNLGENTHRGLEGRVLAGKSGGGLCYGYKVVGAFDANGKLIRGEREICPVESKIVIRIFELFTNGSSPDAIAKLLNKEGIPGPEGCEWGGTTIRGNGKRGTGILRNALYAGQLVWNKLHYQRNPENDKRISRLNPPEEWTRVEVPNLRIVPEELWQNAQARLQQTSVAISSPADLNKHRRPQHILTGKLICGCCNRPIGNVGRDYLACTAATKKGTCKNKKAVRRGPIEKLILDALSTKLMAPDAIEEAVNAFIEEWNRLVLDSAGDRAADQRALGEVEKKIAGTINAITDGFRAPGLQEQLDKLYAQKSMLTDKLAEPQRSAPAIHPNVATLYRDRVADLQKALLDSERDQGIIDAIRNLVEKAVIHPPKDGRGIQIELTGCLSEMLALGVNRPANSRVELDLFERSVMVVAGTGNHRQLTLPPITC